MSLTNEELKWATILVLTEPPQRCKPKEEPTVVPYLTFHSEDGEFTLRVYDNTKHWNGIIEYSTDTENWAVWTGATISSLARKLYLRGSGNTAITGYQNINGQHRWVLSGTNISCTGNIENLLDYSTVARGEHPTMSYWCFAALFYYCTSLITAPELPAIDLNEYCYGGMFSGCSSLTMSPDLPATNWIHAYVYSDMFSYCESLVVAPRLPSLQVTTGSYSTMFKGCINLTEAPELPATVLGSDCYGSMFAGCNRLSVMPELPATTLKSTCYMGMFRDCPLIKLSATKTGNYQYPYRIPTTGTGTTASSALMDMFYNTGGPFTGTPTINTTYYTDHEPV